MAMGMEQAPQEVSPSLDHFLALGKPRLHCRQIPLMAPLPPSTSSGCSGRQWKSRKPEGPRNRADQPAIGSNRERQSMPLYEHVFLARQDLSQAQVDALAANATAIVEANQGKVTKTESWGLKGLAYKIKRNRKAHFVLLNLDAPGDAVAELERQTQINEDVIRYMTVRVEEHEVEPSVQMRKQDRERTRRRDREEMA
jgi:small subunit ribosomal protein S6